MRAEDGGHPGQGANCHRVQSHTMENVRDVNQRTTHIYPGVEPGVLGGSTWRIYGVQGEYTISPHKG